VTDVAIETPADEPPAGRKSWADLSPATRAAIVAGGVAEVIVTTLALLDLVRRPGQDVRGPKLFWITTFVVQPFGPLLYFAAGRRD
jgi:Phospholipase_D-nuclease N-terminal